MLVARALAENNFMTSALHHAFAVDLTARQVIRAATNLAHNCTAAALVGSGPAIKR